MIRPRIQTGQILAGTLTLEFDMNTGSEYPENVVVFLTNSAMSAADTVLATEIDIKAAESTTVRQVLAATSTGPLDKLKLVALNIAAAETIDFVILSW